MIDRSEIVVSGEAIIHGLIFLLYLTVFIVGCQKLLPRLNKTAKRIAVVMLAAQILVIVLAMHVDRTSTFDRWVWDINAEWNIPTTFATTQLAMVVGVAWITVWQVRSRSGWLGLYVLGTSLVLLVFLLDEHLRIHEANSAWVNVYIALGIAVAAATALRARRAPGGERIWYVCLLIGLTMSGFGAVILDKTWSVCEIIGPLRLSSCIFFYPLEESFEFSGIWLTLVAMLGFLSYAAPANSPRLRLSLLLLPAVWLVLLIAYALFPRLELKLLAQPTPIDFERGVHLRGYRLETSRSATRLQLYATASQQDYIGLGYSIHLVDQVNGKSIASDDRWADRRHSLWFLGPEYMPVYRQAMEVIHPPDIPVNRALWVVLTTWRMKRGEFQSQLVLASDRRQLNDTQIVLDELVMPASPAIPAAVPQALFSNGFTLDAINLSESARRGAILPIQFTWRSDHDSHEDYVQFLHLMRVDGGEWWGYDQRPLGPRLPTPLWYSGLADSETWEVPLPADLAPGTYNVYTGIYRISDKERVPASDAEGKPYLDARVLLGQLIILD